VSLLKKQDDEPASTTFCGRTSNSGPEGLNRSLLQLGGGTHCPILPSKRTKPLFNSPFGIRFRLQSSIHCTSRLLVVHFAIVACTSTDAHCCFGRNRASLLLPTANQTAVVFRSGLASSNFSGVRSKNPIPLLYPVRRPATAASPQIPRAHGAGTLPSSIGRICTDGRN